MTLKDSPRSPIRGLKTAARLGCLGLLSLGFTPSAFAAGSKILYFLTNGVSNASGTLWRVQAPASTGTAQTINSRGGTAVWTLEYQTAEAMTMSSIVVDLYVVRGSGGGSRTMTAALSNGTTTLTSSNTLCSPTTATPPQLCQITVTGSLAVNAGTQLTLTLSNLTSGNHPILVYPEFSTATQSELIFNITPAINVDSLNIYNTAYSGTGTLSVYEANSPIYIRTVVSDPFGCFDIGTAALTVTDANSVVQVNGASLLADNKTTCTAPTAPTAYAATQTFEYPLTICLPTTGGCTIPTSNGTWTASVTAKEGAEQTISNTGSSTFTVGAPSILIMKSVTITQDPVNGTTTPRAIPGGTAKYSIVVTNTGNGAANGLYVTDPIPTNTSFVVGSPGFTDGSPTSGLTAPTYSYDNASCSGAFTYTPVAGANGADPNVKCVKATFTGSMAGYTTLGSNPSFTIAFNSLVN